MSTPRPSMTTRRRLVLLAVLGLLVAACGVDQSGGTTGSIGSLAMADSSSGDRSDGAGLRLGILGECNGAFRAFHEDTIAGASLAMIERAGATSNSRTTALDGFRDASVAGVDIELIGIGCGDDTAITAVQEVRRLVEDLGADVVIGPLSGDEGVAVANYALQQPDVIFLSGSAGAQEATLRVKAPNFFRFSGDGAQFNAGLGDILHNVAGWETAAVIADDYSFGWTSAAGFIAEFCAAGGTVVSRTFPRLGTTDYDPYIADLPDPETVDGYFWALGGSGAEAALRSFVNRHGPIEGAEHAGNLFLNAELVATIGPGIAGAYHGGFASLPPDVRTPDIEAFEAAADDAYDSLVGGLSNGRPTPASESIRFGFGYAYYVAGLALVEAIETTGGDLDPMALRQAIGSLTLDAPYGQIHLDENRQGVVTSSVQQVVIDEAGQATSETVVIVHEVDQSFGGLFTGETPPPSREQPACVPGDLPWIGHGIPVIDGVPRP